jgi:hypothetical protein
VEQWGGWTYDALSPHRDVRPYERPSLQISHTNRGIIGRWPWGFVGGCTGGEEASGDMTMDLHDAAMRGDVVRLRRLVAAGADVDEPDERGIRALHWAAAMGQVETVRALVRLGADKGATDARGRRPLHWASAMAEVAAALEAAAAAAAAERRQLEGRLAALTLRMQRDALEVQQMQAQLGVPPAAPAPHPDDAQDQCVLCFDAPKDHIIIPCGHVCACEACANQLTQRNSACPICRAAIQQTNKVFLS